MVDEGAIPAAAAAVPNCPVGEAECGHLEELARLREAVRTDALTGLFNYRHFSELLAQEVERAGRSALPLALVMVDLDHFKRVNDRWGHEAGNRVLVTVAHLLKSGVRRIDAVCRYGGEEMAMILPATPLVRAIEVAERLRTAIAGAGVAVGGERVPVTASFGVAVFPADGVGDAAALVQGADGFLYQAKEAGRNRVRHPPVGAQPPASRVSAEEKQALLE